MTIKSSRPQSPNPNTQFVLHSRFKIGGQIATKSIGPPRPFPRVMQVNFGRGTNPQSSSSAPSCIPVSSSSQGGATPQGSGISTYRSNFSQQNPNPQRQYSSLQQAIVHQPP